jgi:hypothetical protein
MIAANDRGTNEVFVEAAHTAAYAWNSSPIDGTDIIRSVPAVGRPFRFPFDLSFSGTPSPSISQAQDVHSFLRLSSSTTQFAERVLRLLTEDRRAAHRARINDTRRVVTYSIGDLVMARVQVQSNASTGTVAKLSYRLRGPYVITSVSGYGAYTLQRHGHPESALLRHHAENLSALPPALLPCAPVDTPDFRYLNHSHSPLPHPLKSPFNIQMYNNVWFSTKPSTHPPSFDFTDTPILPPSTDPPFPLPAASLPVAAAVPTIPDDDPTPTPIPATATTLLAAITASTDRLFFISYRAAGTLRPRWFLVQVDLASSLVDPHTSTHPVTGIYYCHFFSQHPDDVSSTDPTSRFWALWHRFTTSNDGIIDYHERVLFTPSTTPDPTSYIAWADAIPLLDPTVTLLGPFSFLDPSANPPGRTSSYH